MMRFRRTPGDRFLGTNSLVMGLLAGLPIVLAGCPIKDLPECTEFEEVFVWADLDGDGFGRDEPIGYVCKAGPGQATNNADCDDDQPTVYPGAEEICDLLDNNCNDRTDEDQPKLRWYHDADGDGYGSPQGWVLECVPPDETWILQAGDCDDNNALINPIVREICNDGIDDDCDGLADDADGGVDPTTFTRWYRDDDNDGFGDPLDYDDRCVAPPGSITNNADCDDARATVNPLGSEICNNRDDDCDGLTDDADPSVDPADQIEVYADTDGDGYGDINSSVLVCTPTPGLGVTNADDCDDTNPEANIDKDWYVDGDGDGYGAGAPVLTQCLHPGNGLVPLGGGLDCDDDNALIHPEQIDICSDGVDVDCSGSDDCATCRDWQVALGSAAVSGVFTIEPTPGQLVDVYCDMDTDGGGWTLVASTLGTLDDAGTATAYADLQTLEPSGFSSQVWNGLRSLIGARGGLSDIRFACKNSLSNPFNVDLSFYENTWYYEITTGTDSQSCFNENNGVGADFPPARRNNVTGNSLPAGDQWNSGYLEGEDSCTDTSDFTIDFDDRGMDSNQGDGTDWGEDDATRKCGFSFNGEAYFIFVREL